jgi:phosphoribosylformimino-5-aminoimidazole carboxamide ribotide isomerase
MRIIPVLDILNKKVVQGVRGERDKYQPIKSVFCETADILEVIDKFVNLFNFKEFYIADLDSITKNEEHFEYLENILKKYNITINIDAGIYTLERARKIIKKGVSNLIIGTETLKSLDFIRDLKKEFNRNKVKLIISIDLYKGENLTSCPEIKDLSVLETIKEFQKFDIEEFIILDLSRVGSKLGGASNLVYNVIDSTNAKIITGGGINSIKEIKELDENGINGVLIATSFHNGSITPDEIKDYIS